MNRINSLIVFLKKANLKKEAIALKKLAAPPLETDFLDLDDRAEVFKNTKKIKPKIYVGKNLLDLETFISLRNYIGNKDLRWELEDIFADFSKDLLFIVKRFSFDFYEDNFKSLTYATSKDKFLAELMRMGNSLNKYDSYPLKKKCFAFLINKIKSVLGSLPENYDMYFFTLFSITPETSDDAKEYTVTHDYNKGYVYHDFLGHSFENLISEFFDLINDYIIDVLRNVFSLEVEGAIQKTVDYFIDLIGWDNYSKLFGQELSSSVMTANFVKMVDSIYDLFSILMKDHIRINKVNIVGIQYEKGLRTGEIAEIGLEEQKVFDELCSKLERDLNAIKESLVSKINKDLEEKISKGNNLLLQFVDKEDT